MAVTLTESAARQPRILWGSLHLDDIALAPELILFGANREAKVASTPSRQINQPTVIPSTRTRC